ncbi:MAG: hypothetical protein ABEH86_05950 [Haloarcula sp.]
MLLQPLHMPVDDTPIITHAINEHVVADILVGVGIALCLFGLYYRLILLPANERNSSKHSQDQSPPGDTRN